ncbi:MAG: hypothetical protein NW703_07280 [Nitrospiraceae bacterium]
MHRFLRIFPSILVGLASLLCTLPNTLRAESAETFEIEQPELQGQWEIKEEDKSYVATLDQNGHGFYTWQNGEITVSKCHNRRCEGTWKQTGNDREGGFDVLFGGDGSEARGVWWYSRVGNKNNIPPRQWGGPYTWKRVDSPSTSHTPR